MIARCPICSTRHDIAVGDPEGGGILIDCAGCGHSWVEGVSSSGPQRNEAPAPVQVPKQLSLHPLVESARRSQAAFRQQRRARKLRIAVWAALGALAAAPAVAALTFPEQVVAAVPASIGLYDWMGREVNIYGLEIRHLDLQHLVIDGRKVIAIKGELANVSGTERKIPWLRFGLRSKDNAEVYHWTLEPDVHALKAGETTSFVTRLASPPEDARNLEIRFARADEIGSNATP